MTTSPRRAALLILAAAILLPGCATQREVGLPVVYGARVLADPAPPGAGAGGLGGEEPEGPQDADYWQPVADDFSAAAPPIPAQPPTRSASRRRLASRAAASRAAVSRSGGSRAAATRAAPRAARRKKEPVDIVLVPRQRARKAARTEGKRTGKTAAQLAVDHYLDYPTHIRAEKITFACPKSYAARVHLEAEHMDRSLPGRVRGQGGARLRIGELTLEAERITWRLQAEGKQDVQILARGDVYLVSHVRGHIQQEKGIRGLVIKNDKAVPLP